MKKTRLPKTDSIQQLAQFWDKHDLTDFEEELEEVTEPVFERDDAIKIQLASNDAKTLEKMARERGISGAKLIQSWVQQRLLRVKNGRAVKRKSS